MVQEIPNDGPISDLLWSDPAVEDGFNISPRGAGFIFGKDESEKFIHQNNLKNIYRAHQMM